MNNRNGFTPVSLTREYPVTKLVINLLSAYALFGQPFNNAYLCFFNALSVEEARINHNSGCAIGERFLFDLTALYNLDNREIKLFSKFPVASIMGRNSHNCARTIRNENVIRNKNRNFCIVNGVNCLYAFKLNACLFLNKLGALKVRFFRRFDLIFSDSIYIRKLVSPLFDKRMLGRNYHICSAKKCIGTSCINHQIVTKCSFEFHLCAG